MRHQQQQQPAQRGGRGNASRLQPVSCDASFGSGSAGCIPEAELGAGASGAPTAGGSSSGKRSPEGAPLHHPSFGQGLRTGSFRFQVCTSVCFGSHQCHLEKPAMMTMEMLSILQEPCCLQLCQYVIIAHVTQWLQQASLHQDGLHSRVLKGSQARSQEALISSCR